MMLRRAHVLVVGKLIVAAALLLLLLRKVDFAALAGMALAGNPALYALAFLTFGLARLSEAVRMAAIVPQHQVSLVRSAEIVFVSTFFNNVTAAVVGDGYKVVSLRNKLGDWYLAVSVVFVERAVGFLVVIVFVLAYGVAGFVWSPLLLEFQPSVPTAAFVALVLATAAALVLASDRLGSQLRKITREAARKCTVLISAVSTVSWVVAFAASALAQLFLALMVYGALAALGETVALVSVFFVMLVVYLAAYVPISIGSLGVREGILALGLPLFGASPEAALSAALLTRLMIYVYAGLAGLWLLQSGLGSQAAPRETYQ